MTNTTQASWVKTGGLIRVPEFQSHGPFRAITNVFVDCYVVHEQFGQFGMELGLFVRACGKLQFYVSVDKRLIVIAWTVPRGRKQNFWLLKSELYDLEPRAVVFSENVVRWIPPPKPPLMQPRTIHLWDDVITLIPEDDAERERLILYELNNKVPLRTLPAGFVLPPSASRSHDGFARDESVRQWALRRANWCCEACGMPAPFVTDSGEPYLEVHHLRRLADGGPDTPDNVAALCANCHREVHDGVNAADIRESLIRRREAEITKEFSPTRTTGQKRFKPSNTFYPD